MEIQINIYLSNLFQNMPRQGKITIVGATGMNGLMVQYFSPSDTSISYCTLYQDGSLICGDKVADSWLGEGLVISKSLVQFPAGALWSVLGQDSLFHMASVYPAAKWVPSINKAGLRACALYAASRSGISSEALKWFPCVQAC